MAFTGTFYNIMQMKDSAIEFVTVIVSRSPLAVFLRFLSLLSSHNWAAEPLIINFNSELSSKLVNSDQTIWQDKASVTEYMYLSGVTWQSEFRVDRDQRNYFKYFFSCH